MSSDCTKHSWATVLVVNVVMVVVMAAILVAGLEGLQVVVEVEVEVIASCMACWEGTSPVIMGWW